MFDREGRGYITPTSLKDVMENILGEEITQDEVQLLLQEADVGGDGMINFQEFAKMMTQN